LGFLLLGLFFTLAELWGGYLVICATQRVTVGGLFCLIACAQFLFLFTYLRLYWSYWQHDRHCSLVFYKEQNQLVYWIDAESITYNLSEVVCRTRHAIKSSKLSFAYTILSFKDGKQLLATHLLCDDFAYLLPNTKYEAVASRYPWLPATQAA